jgi:hypothetical protein
MPDKMVAHAVERNWSPSSITGNFLKISGQNRLLARKKDRPFEIRQLSQIVAAALRHFPVILQNRQLKRKNRP